MKALSWPVSTDSAGPNDMPFFECLNSNMGPSNSPTPQQPISLHSLRSESKLPSPTAAQLINSSEIPTLYRTCVFGRDDQLRTSAGDILAPIGSRLRSPRGRRYTHHHHILLYHSACIYLVKAPYVAHGTRSIPGKLRLELELWIGVRTVFRALRNLSLAHNQ
jgi:hypothetical protein